jgi:glycosyltransferase involved in cell wall biosynthesis
VFWFFYRGKDFEQLIETLADIKQQQPELVRKIKITFAGGSQPDLAHNNCTTYIDELKTFAKKHKILDSLSCITDVNEDTTNELIQAHHLVLLPYKQSTKLKLLGNLRGASGVLARALGTGRGVITSSACSLPEELDNAIGLLYQDGQLSDSTDAIISAIEQKSDWQSWADNAHLLGKQRSWEVMGKNLLIFLEHELQKT